VKQCFDNLYIFTFKNYSHYILNCEFTIICIFSFSQITALFNYVKLLAVGAPGRRGASVGSRVMWAWLAGAVTVTTPHRHWAATTVSGIPLKTRYVFNQLVRVWNLAPVLLCIRV